MHRLGLEFEFITREYRVASKFLFFFPSMMKIYFILSVLTFSSIIRSLLVRCRFFNARIGKDERDEGMKRGSINNNKINLPDELVEINFIEIGIYQLSTDCIFLIFRMESSHPCPPHPQIFLPRAIFPLERIAGLFSPGFRFRFIPSLAFIHVKILRITANSTRSLINPERSKLVPLPLGFHAITRGGSTGLRLVNQQRIVSSTIGGVTMHSRNWRPTPVVGSVEL